MIRKTLLAAALLTAIVPAAMAQQSGTSALKTMPTGSSMGSDRNSSPAEAEVKAKLEKAGYSNIILNEAASSGSSTAPQKNTPTGKSAVPQWSGTAIKSGKQVPITVMSDGTISQGAHPLK